MTSPQIIMIVEPEQGSRVMIRSILEGAGFCVVSAGNAEEALTLLASMEPPSMILVNTHNRAASGTELLEKMAAFPSYSKVPAVQITTNSETNFIQTSMKLESETLSKKLLPVIRKHLQIDS